MKPIQGVVPTSINDATIVNADLVNSTVQSGKISFFKSTEQTADGLEQDIAHSLGRTPTLVIPIVTETGVATDIAEGTHDGTNVKITATTGIKYKVIAL